mgnify:CR=1 FL=1
MVDNRKKVKSVLKDEKVIVRYIRDNNRYTGKHILAGGLHKDCGTTLTIRRKNGRVINFLSDEEVDALSIQLGDISPSNEEFWKDTNLEVKLVNGDIILDLSDPIDYIKWRNLQQYDMLIAPSWGERSNMRTYRWVFVYNNDDADSANQELDLKMKSYMLLGKHETNIQIMSYLYFKLVGKLIDPKTKVSTIRGWFKDVLDNQTAMFVKFAEDKLLEEKAIVFHALRNGVLSKSGDMIYYGDKKLSDDPKICNTDIAAEFISTVDNQQIKLELKAKIST